MRRRRQHAAADGAAAAAKEAAAAGPKEAAATPSDGVAGQSGPVSVGTTGNKWLVDRLVASRVSEGRKAGDTHRKGVVLYKVLWVGLGEDEATWEPKSYLTPELVSAFQQEQQAAAAAAEQQPPGAQELATPSSPSGEKRKREAACSPSAKSPDAKRG